MYLACLSTFICVAMAVRQIGIAEAFAEVRTPCASKKSEGTLSLSAIVYNAKAFATIFLKEASPFHISALLHNLCLHEEDDKRAVALKRTAVAIRSSF